MNATAKLRLTPLLGTVAVVCVYVVVRAVIYHFLPATSVKAWFVRDSVMCLPRLGAFGALLWLNRKWKSAGVEWRLANPGRAILFAIVPVALWVFYFQGGSGLRYGPIMIVIGFLNSAVVGLFEEYAFRGPMLVYLRERFSLLLAVALSSFLFAIYHVQAQSPRIWGVVFLMGVVFANLRFRGVSLGWLVIIHSLIDGCYFLFPATNPEPFGFYGLVLHGGLLVYAMATFPWLQAAQRKL